MGSTTCGRPGLGPPPQGSSIRPGTPTSAAPPAGSAVPHPSTPLPPSRYARLWLCLCLAVICLLLVCDLCQYHFCLSVPCAVFNDCCSPHLSTLLQLRREVISGCAYHLQQACLSIACLPVTSCTKQAHRCWATSLVCVQHYWSESKAVHVIGERAGWYMAVSAHPQQREGHSAAEPAELRWWARHLGLG